MSKALFSDPEMQEIFEAFLVETREILDSLSQDLIELENRKDDIELLNKIFRSFHTIKGTSSFMGFNDISEITHHAEDILNKLRKGELIVTLPIIDVLLEVYDWIQLLMENIQSGTQSHIDYSQTIQKIEALKNASSPPTETKEKVEQKETVTEQSTEPQAVESKVAETQTTIPEDPLKFVLENQTIFTKPGDFTDEELKLIDSAFEEVNKILAQTEITQKEEKIVPINELEGQKQEEKVIEQKDKEPQPKEVEKPVPAPAITEIQKSTKTPQQTKTASETIRIDVNRVETLMDLSGELVLARNRLLQISKQLESEITNKESLRDLTETFTQIDFVTSEIQTAAMKMRMVPINKLFQKAPRIIRDLSKEFGKKINLRTSGEETEIDRGIIEELNDPLVHMLRNSCDHGIETPEERIKLGKPEYGTISLDALQEGNAIVIKITDDGRGIDTNKILEKAIEKGLISAENGAQLSKREIYQFIFHPGFSTAQKVSAVSGRGVGMDVVRTNIQKLKGMVDIESEVGKGTTFIIKLPLTLAIIQGLLVKVSTETFAIPLSNVVEVVSVDNSKLYTVHQHEVIKIREDILPLIRLENVLNIKPSEKDINSRYVVVVGIDTRRVGFVVDELLGQQEIVIKSLGDYLGQIPGIAGATILGNGSVIIIIDVADLIQKSYTKQFVNF